jgi:hypothetical protein
MQLPIPVFKVLLYGPGLPTAGLQARARFEESVLVVQGKGHWFTIQGDRLSLKTGGFDGRQWMLGWSTPSGPVEAMLQGDDAVKAFIRHAPPAVSSELKRIHRACSVKNRKWNSGFSLFSAFVFMSFFAFGIFWFYEDGMSDGSPQRVSLMSIDQDRAVL